MPKQKHQGHDYPIGASCAAPLRAGAGTGPAMIGDLPSLLLALAVLFIPMGLQWFLLVVLESRARRRSRPPGKRP